MGGLEKTGLLESTPKPPTTDPKHPFHKICWPSAFGDTWTPIHGTSGPPRGRPKNPRFVVIVSTGIGPGNPTLGFLESGTPLSKCTRKRMYRKADCNQRQRSSQSRADQVQSEATHITETSWPSAIGSTLIAEPSWPSPIGGTTDRRAELTECSRRRKNRNHFREQFRNH